MRFIRRAKFGLLLACVPMFSAGCASLSPKLSALPSIARLRAESQYQSARTAEQRGNLEQARDLYASLQRQSPNTPDYAHRMGVVCTQLQDHVTAGKYFEHARALDPHNPALLADMGYSAYLQKDYTIAETLLKESIRLRPNDPRSVNNLAMAIGFQGRYDECQAMFCRVNSEPQSLLNVAFIQSQIGTAEAAISSYERVLSQEPGNKVANLALQQLYAANSRRSPVASRAATGPDTESVGAAKQPATSAAARAWEVDVSTTATTATNDDPIDLPPPVIASSEILPTPSADPNSPVIIPGDFPWATTPSTLELTSTPTEAAVGSEFELPERSEPPAQLATDPDETPVATTEPLSPSASDDLANVFEGDDNAPENADAGMDDLTGLDWAQEGLAQEREAVEAGVKSSPQTGDCLRGFCPVTLRDERRLTPALDDFTAEHQAQTYRFSSAEARERFLEHPEWYVPAAGGLDVIEIKRGHNVTQGSLDFAVWFRHRLHMFSNAENLAAFRATPREFVTNP